MRKARKLRAVAVRKRVAITKALGAVGEVGDGEPVITSERIIEFPKPPAANDVVSERVIFDIGGDRFAIKWSAEIEPLPPAGPKAIERKQRLKLGRSPQLGVKIRQQRMTFGPPNDSLSPIVYRMLAAITHAFCSMRMLL